VHMRGLRGAEGWFTGSAGQVLRALSLCLRGAHVMFTGLAGHCGSTGVQSSQEPAGSHGHSWSAMSVLTRSDILPLNVSQLVAAMTAD